MSDIGAKLASAIAAAGYDIAPQADPGNVAELLALLTKLHAIGRHDLPLGRLFEGHIDAVQIIMRYATGQQCAALRTVLARGATLGVWNAGLANEPLRLADGVLAGGKSYASGAGIISHALVTAETSGGAQLVLVDLSRHPPAIDGDWWRTIGMQRSETHRVRWTAAGVGPDAVIGALDDYAKEPHLSGGALRFVAVQAGGIAGLLDCATAHLVARERANDPVQAMRLARLYALAEIAVGAVQRGAVAWFDDAGAQLARVAAARSIVAAAADEALTVAQQAVGLEGMFVDHPLSALIADLAVYLRQPAPDAAQIRVGRAVADRTLTVEL